MLQIELELASTSIVHLCVTVKFVMHYIMVWKIAIFFLNLNIFIIKVHTQISSKMRQLKKKKKAYVGTFVHTYFNFYTRYIFFLLRSWWITIRLTFSMWHQPNFWIKNRCSNLSKYVDSYKLCRQRLFMN